MTVPRVFHSMTQLRPNQFLIVGGLGTGAGESVFAGELLRAGAAFPAGASRCVFLPSGPAWCWRAHDAGRLGAMAQFTGGQRIATLSGNTAWHAAQYDCRARGTATLSSRGGLLRRKRFSQ